MTGAKSGASGAYDSHHGFVISGGHDGAQWSDQMERTLDGETFEEFDSLPTRLLNESIQASVYSTTHCLTSLDDGGSLFLAGLGLAYIYRNSQWDRVQAWFIVHTIV